MTAGVYARKSTQETGKEAPAKSVAVQIAEAKRYAAQKGWRVLDAHVYADDAVSGAEFTKRPGLAALLAAVEGVQQPPFEVLLMSEQSRLGRDTLLTLALIKRLEDAGLALYGYLDDSQITVAQDTDEIREFIRAWAGSQEHRKASQRTRSVARRTVEAGRRHGGKLYGFGPGGVRVPAEVAVIERIFRERAAGQGLYVIARGLEQSGIAPPSASRQLEKNRGTSWYVSQVQAIIRNTTYKGLLTWGAMRRVYRKGTARVEASPENVITVPAARYRLVSDKLWAQANAVSDASAANTWRDAAGRLKSRATKSPFLLSPFLACGLCGGSMHAKQSGKGPRKRWLYTCTRYHLTGKRGCPNGKGLRVEWADTAVLNAFEEALVGHVVLKQLHARLDEQKRRAIDPAPLRAEAAALKKEITNLVNALAKGDLEEVHDAVRARKARLEHLEGTLQGLGVAESFDLSQFAERVLPVLADWREHLRRNTSTAAQVLRKIIPTRLTVTPKPGGGWSIDGLTDYSAILKECGLSAVEAVLTEVAKLKGSPARRGARRAA